jgi:predicted MFS family arabinose efflux permease
MKLWENILSVKHDNISLDGILALLWRAVFWALTTLKVICMLVAALLLAGPSLPHRQRGRCWTRRNVMVLQIWAVRVAW